MFIEIANAAYGEATNGSLFGANMEFGDFVLTGISIFVLAAGILSITFILWGGLLLILSGGKDDKIKPAINTIRFAILGIVMTVVTIFIFPIFGKLLGLDVEKYADPNRIFAKIEYIGSVVFPSNNSVNLGDQNIDNLDANFSDL